MNYPSYYDFIKEMNDKKKRYEIEDANRLYKKAIQDAEDAKKYRELAYENLFKVEKKNTWEVLSFYDGILAKTGNKIIEDFNKKSSSFNEDHAVFLNKLKSLLGSAYESIEFTDFYFIGYRQYEFCVCFKILNKNFVLWIPVSSNLTFSDYHANTGFHFEVMEKIESNLETKLLTYDENEIREYFENLLKGGNE